MPPAPSLGPLSMNQVLHDDMKDGQARALVGLEGQFLSVNNALSGFLGFTPENLRRMRFQHITHADDLLRDEARLEGLFARGMGSYSMLKRYWHADGHPLWAELGVRLVLDRQGKPSHFISDIRPTQIDEDTLTTLHRQAYQDPLTDIANRSAFDEHLNACLRRYHRKGEGFALVFLDLDGFKQINDDRGHAVGDALLVQVAQRLTAARGPHDLLARIGGDEFALILRAPKDALVVQQTMAALRQCFAAPFLLPDGPLTQVASLGCALCPRDGQGRQALLSCADSRMYQDKRRRFTQ